MRRRAAQRERKDSYRIELDYIGVVDGWTVERAGGSFWAHAFRHQRGEIDRGKEPHRVVGKMRDVIAKSCSRCNQMGRSINRINYETIGRCV